MGSPREELGSANGTWVLIFFLHLRRCLDPGVLVSAPSPFDRIDRWTRSPSVDGWGRVGKLRRLEYNLELWITAMLSRESLPRDLPTGSIARFNEIAPRRTVGRVSRRCGIRTRSLVPWDTFDPADATGIPVTWQAFHPGRTSRETQSRDRCRRDQNFSITL